MIAWWWIPVTAIVTSLFTVLSMCIFMIGSGTQPPKALNPKSANDLDHLEDHFK